MGEPGVDGSGGLVFTVLLVVLSCLGGQMVGEALEGTGQEAWHSCCLSLTYASSAWTTPRSWSADDDGSRMVFGMPKPSTERTRRIPTSERRRTQFRFSISLRYCYTEALVVIPREAKFGLDPPSESLPEHRQAADGLAVHRCVRASTERVKLFP